MSVSAGVGEQGDPGTKGRALNRCCGSTGRVLGGVGWPGGALWAARWVVCVETVEERWKAEGATFACFTVPTGPDPAASHTPETSRVTCFSFMARVTVLPTPSPGVSLPKPQPPPAAHTSMLDAHGPSAHLLREVSPEAIVTAMPTKQRHGWVLCGAHPSAVVGVVKPVTRPLPTVSLSVPRSLPHVGPSGAGQTHHTTDGVRFSRMACAPLSSPPGEFVGVGLRELFCEYL